LSPNPVVNDVKVQFSGVQFTKPVITIRDVRGNKVFEDIFEIKRNESSILIDMSLYASGLYFISASEGSQKLTKRIIKN